MNENLTYGEALEAAKKGKLIARKGWNGKGMFVFMRPADELSVDFVVNRVKSLPQSVKDYFTPYLSVHPTDSSLDAGHATVVKFSAYLCMKAADNSIVNGWLASQTDMLSEDWCVL
ncbi:DUF2829 domain-containing protein [Salegentibacter sp. BDJ18]|uniref:DUF2829 domain-containing protein n=1 Tax=Salegentibacter sp. BDJ18 TaxID=2816376 RepID=UPI001AAEF970|nr:DUF2829 domain-containing protein [Salegentibacter sp. BDJ18]MBO2546100.1 DUF2829 domain-containing protein [Salegentibacter sp. BDJ18]